MPTCAHPFTTLAAALAAYLAMAPAQAADRYWSPGCTAHSWAQSCWTSAWNLGTLGAAPQAGDRALLRHVGANDLLVQYRSSSAPRLAELQMDALGSGLLTVHQLDDTLHTQAAGIGLVGQAAWRSLGGSLQVDGLLQLGRDAGASGRLSVEGGQVSTGSLQLGLGAGANGWLSIDSGGVGTGSLQLGAAGQAELQLRGGSLAVTGDWLSGADSRFQWEAGSLQLGARTQWQQASFADLSGSRLVLAQAAGQSLRAQQWQLAGQGRAGFTQAGGSLQVDKLLTLGQGNQGQGEWLLQGGSAQVQELVLGDAGQGRLVQSGGSLQVQALQLAREAGSRGTLVLEGGSSRFANGFTAGAGFSEVVWHSGVDTDLRNFRGLSRLHLRGAPDSAFAQVLDRSQQIDVGELALDGGLLLRQTEGRVTVRDNLLLGASREFAYTTYQLQGGLLDVGRIAGPWQTARELRLEGGELRFGTELALSRLLVARTPGSRFHLSLQADQLMDVSELYLGHEEGGGQARFDIHGGTLGDGNAFGSTIRLYGDAQVMHGGGSVLASYLSLSGGQAQWVQRGGRLDVTSNFSIGGGRFAIEGSGFTEVDSAANLGGGGRIEVQAGGLFLNGVFTLGSGTVQLSGGRLTVRNDWRNGEGEGRLVWTGGRLELQGTQFRLDALELGPAVNLVRGVGQEVKLGELTNAGRLELAGRSEIGRFEHHGSLLNTGGMLLVDQLDSDGRMDLHNPGLALQVRGDALLREGASFHTYASTRLQFDGGLSLHPGVLIQGPGGSASGPQLQVNGRLDLQPASPSEMVLDASLQLGDAAILRVDLGSLQGSHRADAWTLSGELLLGGTLELVAGQGFVGHAGAVFTLFNAGSLGGAFAHIDSHYAPLAPGLRWDASQLGVDGTLRVSAVPEPQAWALMLAGLGVLGWRKGRIRDR